MAYLPLDIAVASSNDAGMVRAAWTAMGIIAAWVLVPLALTSLFTGLVISVGTRWGLFRHWWVVVSLVLTLLAVFVLLQETSVIGRNAGMAGLPSTPDEHVLALPPTLPHSIGGLFVLLVIQWLNVFKPQGLTPYGWRWQQQERGRLTSPIGDSAGRGR